MLRMQNVIYERGSAARQTAAGASAGAGLGGRQGCGENFCCGQAEVGTAEGAAHEPWDGSLSGGLQAPGQRPHVAVTGSAASLAGP